MILFFHVNWKNVCLEKKSLWQARLKKISLVNIYPVCILLGWRTIIHPSKLTFWLPDYSLAKRVISFVCNLFDLHLKFALNLLF